MGKRVFLQTREQTHIKQTETIIIPPFQYHFFYITGSLVTTPITVLSYTRKDLIYNHDVPQ